MRPLFLLRRKASFLVLAVLLLAAPAAFAQSGGATQGYIGSDPNAAPPPPPPGSVTTAAPPVRTEPPTLPPVFDTVRTSEPETEDGPAIDDPCADFADSYDAYNICQDRIKKIERMRDAKNRRMGISPAPAPAPKAEEKLTPEEAVKQATEKVEELEKKLQEKEDAAAAAKAAPTTKKGIGEFERNPEKGNALFK